MTRAPDHRRHFLKTVPVALAAPLIVPRGVFAEEVATPATGDLPRVAVIGTGERVSHLLGIDATPGQMRIVALADCNLRRIDGFVEKVKGKHPEAEQATRYQHYREMLDKEKLDAVFVSTPTHGRVLPCIHALQAGLDVYAEKPETLTIEEGQALIKAVRHYQRVLQGGTQGCSNPINRWGVAQLQSGVIGKIEKVTMPNFGGPKDYTPLAAAQPVPDGLDWNEWCNQAPLYPCDPGLLGSLWSWGPYRPFDGGGAGRGVTNLGAHAFEQAQRGLGKELESPVETWPAEPGNPDSPISMKYADGTLLEMLGDPETGPAFGAIYFGTKGKMEINRDQVRSNPPEIAAAKPAFPEEPNDAALHVTNFLECIRTRQDPRCPVEAVHRHMVLCHLANVTRELSRRLVFDPATDRFVGDDEANRHPSVSRPRRAGFELPKIG